MHTQFAILLLTCLFLPAAAFSSTPEKISELEKKIVGTWAYKANGKDCKENQKSFSSFGSNVPCTFNGEITFKADKTFTCSGDFKGGLSCKKITPNSWETAADSTEFGKLRLHYKNLANGASSADDWSVKSLGAKQAELHQASYILSMKKK